MFQARLSRFARGNLSRHARWNTTKKVLGVNCATRKLAFLELTRLLLRSAVWSILFKARGSRTCRRLPYLDTSLQVAACMFWSGLGNMASWLIYIKHEDLYRFRHKFQSTCIYWYFSNLFLRSVSLSRNRNGLLNVYLLSLSLSREKKWIFKHIFYLLNIDMNIYNDIGQSKTKIQAIKDEAVHSGWPYIEWSNVKKKNTSVKQPILVNHVSSDSM